MEEKNISTSYQMRSWVHVQNPKFNQHGNSFKPLGNGINLLGYTLAIPLFKTFIVL